MARKKRKGNYPKRRPPLDERHYRAIEMLTTVPRMNHEDIARKLGISRMTLHRWRNRPDFQLEYRRNLDEKIRIMFSGRKRTAWAYAMSGDVEAVEWFLMGGGLLS